MKIVAVTACNAGIAHTYIAAEKLLKAAEAAGHKCKVETQGSSGIENALSEETINEADAVIFAHDSEIQQQERFRGKPIVDIPISMALRYPESVIAAIDKKLAGIE